MPRRGQSPAAPAHCASRPGTERRVYAAAPHAPRDCRSTRRETATTATARRSATPSTWTFRSTSSTTPRCRTPGEREAEARDRAGRGGAGRGGADAPRVLCTLHLGAPLELHSANLWGLGVASSLQSSAQASAPIAAKQGRPGGGSSGDSGGALVSRVVRVLRRCMAVVEVILLERMLDGVVKGRYSLGWALLPLFRVRPQAERGVHGKRAVARQRWAGAGGPEPAPSPARGSLVCCARCKASRQRHADCTPLARRLHAACPLRDRRHACRSRCQAACVLLAPPPHLRRSAACLPCPARTRTARRARWWCRWWRARRATCCCATCTTRT